MFNTAWTDLVLKVGGQILLAVIVILAITFGADSPFPKKNTEEMIGSRSEQPLNTNAAAVKTNAAAQTNAVAKPANIPKAETKSANASSQTNKPSTEAKVPKPTHFPWQQKQQQTNKK